MALRELVTQDVGWKIFSLVLAIIIWLTVDTVSTEPRTGGDTLAAWATRSFTNLPVLIVSAASDVREFKVSPETVDVLIRARPETIASISQQDIRVAVDLTDIQSSRGLRKTVIVSPPPGVTIISVTPPDVNIVVPPKK